MKRLALCIGLTRLDAAAYDGWGGDCPGCDRDAARMGRKCHDVGFDGVCVLVNSMATRATIADVYARMIAELAAGDLMVLYYSGHGGQIIDNNGDEPDGRDETMCWYDGEVDDDTIAEYLASTPAGVRVLFVSDSCNSGSNYRGRPRAVRRDRYRDARASLLHLGGCDDGRYSYGDESGGQFTLALLDALSDARKTLSYSEWFYRSLKRMNLRQQRPVLREVGESFAALEVLT